MEKYMLRKFLSWFQSDKSKLITTIELLAADIDFYRERATKIVEEYTILIGAIALQNGGTLEVGNEFIKTMADDGSLLPKLSVSEDGKIVISTEKVFND